MATAVRAGAHHADYVLADVRRDKTGSSSEASYRKFKQRYQEIGLKAGDKSLVPKFIFNAFTGIDNIFCLQNKLRVCD